MNVNLTEDEIAFRDEVREFFTEKFPADLRQKQDEGVTLDREELERLKTNTPPEQPPYILKTRFKNGTVMYNIMSPKKAHFMVLPNRWRLIPMSFDAPVTTEYWDDDGSGEYKAMFKRLKAEEMVLQTE